MCLLFETNQSTLPRTFIPLNLQPLIDICIHGPEDKRTLNPYFNLDNQFDKLLSLATDAENFHNLPASTSTQDFKDFEKTLEVMAGYPDEL